MIFLFLILVLLVVFILFILIFLLIFLFLLLFLLLFLFFLLFLRQFEVETRIFVLFDLQSLFIARYGFVPLFLLKIAVPDIVIAHRIIHTFGLFIHFDGFVILFVLVVGISDVILFLRDFFLQRVQKCGTLAVLFGFISLFRLLDGFKIR